MQCVKLLEHFSLDIFVRINYRFPCYVHYINQLPSKMYLLPTVSCRAMCTGRRHHGAPQSALSHSRSTKFPSVQHDKLWPTSIFVLRPSCLTLTARTSATNHFNRPFQALSKNVFIRADIALSAFETFLFNGLYKFIYFLTIYLHYIADDVADTVLVTI